MLSSGVLFDFASSFRTKNIKIAAAKDFKFTDGNFKQFQVFLKSDEKFLTKEETSFRKAYKTLNASQNKKIKKEYLRIISTLKTEKIKALSSNKEFLKNEIKDIILDQYYYQEGVYQNNVVLDNTITEAVRLLKNTTKYNQILSGKK